MGYRDPTYVVFDGDNDKWAYGYLKGWNSNEYVDFDFYDAHDLDTMTGRAQDEAYVKARLKERMAKSAALVVLVGKDTRWLYKYVRWELELALDMGLPIIVVNLDGSRQLNDKLCPPILRNECVMHVAFKAKIIKHALDNWPSQYRSMNSAQKQKGWWYYADEVYKALGL